MRKQRKITGKICLIASITLPVLVILSVWVPVISHYYVASPDIPESVVSKLRAFPDDNVLSEIENSYIFYNYLDSDEGIRNAAEEILSGKYTILNYPTISISPEFNPEDFTKNPPTFQLIIASMAIPKILLDAYEITANEKYFKTAVRRIKTFVQYEKSAILPVGFLWNDHAIAARVSVLTKFWKIYRKHALFDDEIAQLILTNLARSAQFLADDAHFTYHTNHGVMQNLALLQIAAAFPDIPGTSAYIARADSRLKDQYAFHMNPEGVILEHSAGYQFHGLAVLEEVLAMYQVLGLDIPAKWIDHFRKGVHFYKLLKRPDQTLPMYGNTSNDQVLRYYDKQILGSELLKSGPEPAKQDSHRHIILPAAGHAVWWYNAAVSGISMLESQTVTTWSYYPGHGHKHADEMSVLLWANGNNWITNIGYYPYGMAHFDSGISWPGSNAPHYQDEPYRSARQTDLIGYLDNENIRFIDMHRKNHDGYSVQRQLLHVPPDLWVVIDNNTDATNRMTETIWTTFPGMKLVQHDKHHYSLTRPGFSLSLDMSFYTQADAQIKYFKGSTQPFAGWVALGSNVVASDALQVISPANSWTVSLWKLGLKRDNKPDNGENVKNAVEQWKDPQHWCIRTTNSSSKDIKICRNNSTLSLNGMTYQVNLTLQDNKIDGQIEASKNAFTQASLKYTIYKDYYEYRIKMTIFLIGLFLAQEIFLLLLLKFFPRMVPITRCFASVGWIAIGAWLPMVYFAG